MLERELIQATSSNTLVYSKVQTMHRVYPAPPDVETDHLEQGRLCCSWPAPLPIAKHPPRYPNAPDVIVLPELGVHQARDLSAGTTEMAYEVCAVPVLQAESLDLPLPISSKLREDTHIPTIDERLESILESTRVVGRRKGHTSVVNIGMYTHSKPCERRSKNLVKHCDGFEWDHQCVHNLAKQDSAVESEGFKGDRAPQQNEDLLGSIHTSIVAKNA